MGRDQFRGRPGAGQHRRGHRRRLRSPRCLARHPPPPDVYPRLVEAAGPMTACDDPEFHTRFGVDLFIAGVQAMAPRR